MSKATGIADEAVLQHLLAAGLRPAAGMLVPARRRLALLTRPGGRLAERHPPDPTGY